MENTFDSHKIEERLNLHIGMLVENEFKDEHSKNFNFNKILYCFSNKYLATGFSAQVIKKLNIDQIEQLIEHNSEQFECRINFITEAIYNKPEINYPFFRNITNKLVFDKLKKVPEAYSYYISDSVIKLKKALVIKHIISLKGYRDSNITIYVKNRIHNQYEDVFNFDDLKKLNVDDLNIINNTLIRNYLLRMEELGEDLDFMSKMQINFTKQQRFSFFK